MIPIVTALMAKVKTDNPTTAKVNILTPRDILQTYIYFAIKAFNVRSQLTG